MNDVCCKSGLLWLLTWDASWEKRGRFYRKNLSFLFAKRPFLIFNMCALLLCTFYVPFMYLLCIFYVCLIFPKTLVYLDLGCYICIFVRIKQLYMYNLLEILSNNLCSWRIPVTGF